MSVQLNKLALLAAKDESLREKIIREQEQTILRTASSASRRFVTKSDDEWSVALYAFSRAIDIYREDKGEFLPFAQMLIRRDLIDHFRSHKHAIQEVPVAPHVMEGNGEPEEDTEGVYLSIVHTGQATDALSIILKDEITSANDMLRQYGFRFFDLAEHSPRQEKTRRECAAAVRYMIAHPVLCAEMKEKHKLPVKSLTVGSGVSRKTLDRYRKYIIMAVLVMDGDYPNLKGYLKFVTEEMSV